MKAEWKAKERAILLDSIPMPDYVLRALFEFLGRDGAPPCDHSLRQTTLFLVEQGLNTEKVETWLRKQGGYCDCEVLANIESTFGDLIGG